jgi:cell division protein FtsB
MSKDKKINNYSDSERKFMDTIITNLDERIFIHVDALIKELKEYLLLNKEFMAYTKKNLELSDNRTRTTEEIENCVDGYVHGFFYGAIENRYAEIKQKALQKIKK